MSLINTPNSAKDAAVHIEMSSEQDLKYSEERSAKLTADL